MSDPFVIVGSALKDLLKFKIIQYISTGDKTYDSLLQTFCISLMTAIAGLISLDLIKSKYYIWKYSRMSARRTKAGALDAVTYKYYSDLSKTSTGIIVQTWTVNEENEEFTNKFCKYFQIRAGWVISSSRPIIMDTKTALCDDKAMSCENIMIGIRQYAAIDYNGIGRQFIPLCVYNGGFAGVTANKNSVLLYANDQETLTHMVKEINSVEITMVAHDLSKKKIRKIHYRNQNHPAFIYPDRTLDRIVSRHIPKIRTSLDNFIHANKGISRLGGFGTYNLGFMLYGRPGTGKTMMIKAIANYLERDVVVIDMRSIKTRHDFENLFYEQPISTELYVLDEFDCVQGVIRDRNDESPNETNKHEDSISDLKQRQLDLMTVLAKRNASEKKDGPNGAVNQDPIMDELEKVKKEIEDKKNALTLDTMLTVLDGTIEMRNRVIIATTNHIEKIDSALLREGRFDLKIKLDLFNEDECRELLYKMYNNTASKEDLERLRVTKIQEDVYTPTQLINLASSHDSLGRVLDIVKV